MRVSIGSASQARRFIKSSLVHIHITVTCLTSKKGIPGIKSKGMNVAHTFYELWIHGH